MENDLTKSESKEAFLKENFNKFIEKLKKNDLNK